MQDVQEFKQRLAVDADLRAFLSKGRAAFPLTLTRAPGRLDVMGGVADYSGSLVAEMTIAEAALVALAPRADRRLRFWSLGLEAEGLAPQVELSLEDFREGDTLRDYPAIHARLCRDPQTRWAAYLAGCFYTLLAEGLLPDFPRGANILLNSQIPLGAGVSSSAAIEVATMQAVSVAYGLNLDGVTLARLTQIVENYVVGAPCGIMDQMTSALGIANSLLLILCQPHEVEGTLPLPEDVRVFGINSNVKHSVGGSAYTRARVAAFMGRKILSVDYLANVPLERYEREWRQKIPKEMLGKKFLAVYGETGDIVTHVDPETLYPIGAATEHGIFEYQRVADFMTGMILDPVNVNLAGQSMYESHASYTSIGLGCAETDFLIKLAKETGPGKGIYGAKITGGGSGGTVALLTYGEQAEQTIREIADAYQQQTGLTPQIFEGGGSPGALAFGHEVVE